MTVESQAEKRAAAQSYDYENDGRWADYWSNVLIPHHMSARPDVQRHFQLKYYQRYIDTDLEVEPLSSLKGSSAPPPPRPSSSTPQQRPVNSGGTGNQARSTGGIPPRPAAPVPPANGALRMDQKSFQFLNNAWVVVMAVLALFPLTPQGLSDRAYRFSLGGSAIACAHCLYLQNRLVKTRQFLGSVLLVWSIFLPLLSIPDLGSPDIERPRSWNLQGLQEWMQSIVPSKEFLSFLFSVIFFSSMVPVKFAVLPVLCRSVEQVAIYLRRNFNSTQLYKTYLQRPCELLLNNLTALHMMSANAEIGIGFLLIFLIVTSQRNFVQTLIYWQLLKLNYRAPTVSSYHQQTWARIGARVNPLIQRFAPVLERPRDYVRNWFLN